jgi:outer membrane receptor protein involved in Fe transport
MLKFFLLAGLLGDVLLRGQTADQPIKLQPFEITTNNNGYLGAETTSGTRYAAPVAEIPFNVQVVTSQMIEDYQAFDLAGQSAFQYTGSFSNAFPESSTGRDRGARRARLCHF